MTGKLRSIMWPAYLAALLLSLPVAPASGRDAGPRSALDRAHLGEDGPQKPDRVANAALSEDDEEDERDGEA
jgi:hypothetical protein